MATTLYRIIKYGILSFKRNALLSTATVIVMVIALLTSASLILFGAVTKIAVAHLQDKIDISVYFKTSATEDQILQIERSLETLKEVKGVEYTSREKALELFRERNGASTVITQALDVLDENPLLASLNVKANDPNEYGLIASYLQGEEFSSLIENVTYTQSRTAIERLNLMVSRVQRIGLGVAIFLALTSVLVTFNTIRLAIYSNRDELSIMRLVGASNIFLNGPYIIEAIIFGVISALLSLILLAPFVAIISGSIKAFIPPMDLQTYFWTNIGMLFLYQVLFGVFLGVISGVIAIRRYLKV
ncbi:MAG: permease-like cell division protein FtsX [Patescibacteria group bacterium]